MPGLSWRDRPVLVTGATGLLGQHLVRALLDRKAAVVAIVRDWVPVSGQLLECVQVRGDVTDQALVERALAEYDVQTVFHLAAQTQVLAANASPVGTFDTNIRGTWAVLEACLRVPVQEIVVASTDKVYGDGQPNAREDAQLHATAPYEASKLCADVLARSYAVSYNQPVVVTRCANLFGPGDLNWNRLIPGTVRSLLYGERPLLRSDGSPRRQYLYVKDAAAAYLRVAEALAGLAPQGQALNIANEGSRSALDVVTAIQAVIGSELKPIHVRTAARERQEQSIDSTKARYGMGWEPEWTLEEALVETVGWYRRYLALDGCLDATEAPVA